MLCRLLLLATLLFLPVTSPAAEDSLGKTLRKIFSTPTPTPKPKKKSATTKKSSPAPSPRKKTSPSPSPTLSPHRKSKSSPTPTPTASPHRKEKASSTPSPTPPPFETPERSTSPSPTPSETPSPTPTPKPGAPNASLRPEEIKGFENYPPKIQQLLRFALDLTTRNLDYEYGSADPANGGMDCSGFVYFVLKQNAVADVPRDSSGQYNWLRRAKRFEAVLSEKDDSFELEELKPGDLLFWTGTYAIERDPPITHAMIYLGREKKNGKRVMVGASDGRVYEGESRNGVSVFNFSVERSKRGGDNGKLRPTFIGYGHLPGLHD